jgi:hypothetical protein
MRKNSIFMAGMLAVLLTFGLVLVGCPTDSDGDDNEDGGIRIREVSASYGWIYIDVGNGLSLIDIDDTTAQNALKANFDVTVNGDRYNVVAVSSAGAIVDGISSMDLVLAFGFDKFTEGTQYAIKIKYTKGTTPITFDNGSELDSFEIEGTITPEG